MNGSGVGDAVKPPSGTTGAEVTGELSVGVHWLRGVAFDVSADGVLETISGRRGDSVVVLERGVSGYSSGWLVGPVRVFANEERPDMGVMVEVTGEGCEELGGRALAELAQGLGLRLSRLDVAVDGCPFTPEQLRDAWRAGDVRTRCQVPDDAREERKWRRCAWQEQPSGDLFTMGSRQSTQYGRVYDRRGFTRFELELKGTAAEAAGMSLLPLLVADAGAAFADGALGWVRRFVDFLEPATADSNVSRRPLAAWWDAFIGAVPRAQVRLGETVVRTASELRDWVEHQVAPALAVVARVFGAGELAELVRRGERRWSARHQAAALQGRLVLRTKSASAGWGGPRLGPVGSV